MIKFTPLVSIMILLYAVSPAYAYHLEGPKWANQPSPGTCCATLYVKYTYGMQAVDKTGWDDGRNAWNNSPAYINYYVTTTYTPITLSDTYNSSVSWDGLTTYSSSGQYFNNATAKLNYYYTGMKTYSRAKIQSVSAHELGHVAGLDHSSGCVLMNPTTPGRFDQCGINSPQTDDISGVDSLY